MLGGLLQTLYSKVFVTIVVERKKSHVYVEVCSSKKGFDLLDNARATFDTESVNGKMIDFIERYLRESPYAYISIMDDSVHQGALPSCDLSKASPFLDLKECEYRCVKDKWIYYTPKEELKRLERKYQQLGLDFIFSSFTVLANFFKDKIETTFAMFVLVQANQLCISVFDNAELLFGANIDMHHIPEEDALIAPSLGHELELDLVEGIDLEDVDVDSEDMELIDDFGDIEDLDSLEEIDEFSQEKDIEEVLYETSSQIETPAIAKGNFNDDYKRFTIVQTAIASYYEDSRYENRFIEHIYVADAVGMSFEFKRYLEEELFVNVYVRQIDMNIELCELAKRELRG